MDDETYCGPRKCQWCKVLFMQRYKKYSTRLQVPRKGKISEDAYDLACNRRKRGRVETFDDFQEFELRIVPEGVHHKEVDPIHQK